MRALVRSGRVRLVNDYPEPVRARGEALISVQLAGICDTDLQLAEGYLNFTGVLGHEFVGTVLECDDAFWVGKRVVADINAGCGDCPDCREADGHHCPARTVLGIAGRDGALAERLVVPQRALVEVPKHVPDEHAVFAEPLAAAAHVLYELRGVQDEPVVVLGDGKLGLLTALVLHARGVEVALVGHHANKLALAASVGVPTRFESALDDAPARASTVVEATGSARGVERAFGLVRPRGTVVLKTTVAKAAPVDLAPIVIDELRLVGSRCGNLALAVQLLADASVDPTPMVTAEYPLTHAERALARAAERGVLKVLVRVGGP